MTATGTIMSLDLKNILYLTDFSQPSEAALPFVSALGRGYDAHIDVLHVMTAACGYSSPRLSAIARATRAARLVMEVPSRLT